MTSVTLSKQDQTRPSKAKQDQTNTRPDQHARGTGEEEQRQSKRRYAPQRTKQASTHRTATHRTAPQASKATQKKRKNNAPQDSTRRAPGRRP
eukprot:2639070-Rhodomonas_salina.2